MAAEMMQVEDRLRAAPKTPEAGSAGIVPASGASARTINTPAGMPALPGQVRGKEKVIIIGAGVAGLSCGCYLQMNGIQTEILEASLLPGGLCTAWHRGPYVFDRAWPPARWAAGRARSATSSSPR